MSRTKAEFRDKMKEIERIIYNPELNYSEYLEGLLDGIKWSAHKLNELDLERFK